MKVARGPSLIVLVLVVVLAAMVVTRSRAIRHGTFRNSFSIFSHGRLGV